MKKISLALLMLFLSLTLAACGAKKEENTVEYKDGTYTKEGVKREKGYETVTVTIADGEITEVVLRRHAVDGTEVNYAVFNGTAGSDGRVRPNLDLFRTELAADMIEAQSADVEIIAGATDTSREWINAVKAILEEATK